MQRRYDEATGKQRRPNVVSTGGKTAKLPAKSPIAATPPEKSAKADTPRSYDPNEVMYHPPPITLDRPVKDEPQKKDEPGQVGQPQRREANVVAHGDAIDGILEGFAGMSQPKLGDRNEGGGRTISRGTTPEDLAEANRPVPADEREAANSEASDAPDEYAEREKKLREGMRDLKDDREYVRPFPVSEFPALPQAPRPSRRSR